MTLKEKVTKVLEMLFAAQVKLASYPTQDGKVLEVNEETQEATIEGQPAPDGEHTLEDGKIAVVAEGKLVEVKEAPAPEEPAAELADEPAKDGFQVAEDGSVSLVEGGEVVVTLTPEQLKALIDQASKAQEFSTQLSAVQAEKKTLETKLKKQPATQAHNPYAGAGSDKPLTRAQQLLASERAKQNK